MTSFQTFQRGRHFVHILPTNQYKTRHMSIKLARPITRETVTPTAMLPYLWMEGTTEHPSAQALMRYADDLYGTVIRTGVGRRGDRHVVETLVSVPEESGLDGAMGVFEKAQALALQLIVDPVREPTGFPTAHVERERALHRKRIESIIDDKIAFAAERCFAEVCKNHPAGLPRLGYLEDVADVTGESLWQAYQWLLSSADAHVYIVGQVGEPNRLADHVLQVLSEHLPTRADHSPQASVQALPTRNMEAQTVIDRQHVNQGKLDVGLRTGLSLGSDDYPALMVCNGVFGGFPHSKLFVNVREKASLAYYASSRLDGLTGTILVQTGIEIGNYERAKAIILEQLKTLQDGNVSEEELNFTKRGIRNQYVQLMDQPISVADVHFSTALAGISREIPELLEQIEATSKDDVVRVAQSLQLDTVYFLRDQEVTADA